MFGQTFLLFRRGLPTAVLFRLANVTRNLTAGINRRRRLKAHQYADFAEEMAEREGFEPSVRLLTVQRFSKPSPSTTRPSLLVGASRAGSPRLEEWCAIEVSNL